MPDYFAHGLFGQMVLERLSGALRVRLESEKTAYFLGQYGPDPMFFIFGRARDEARAMHRAPGAVPLRRLSESYAAGTAQSAGYLAGFLCHFLLDAACHPYILEAAARGPLGHTAIETELDRALIARAGFRPNRDAPMVPPGLPADVCRAASAAYEFTSPQHYDRAYRAFCAVCRGLARAQGTPVRAAVSGLSRLPGLAPIRGCVSGRAGDPAAQETTAALCGRMAAAIEPAARAVTSFFDDLSAGGRPWEAVVYQTDFSGRICRAP